ncbi:MAG: hypothetical protein ACXWEV_01600 [Methylobacter sp.]
MNKTKKPVELLGFVSLFFRFTFMLANPAVLKLLDVFSVKTPFNAG